MNRAAMALVSFVFLAVGCTQTIYSHTIITKYDADGNMTGSEEIESLSQPAAFRSPFKVRITQRQKLEE